MMHGLQCQAKQTSASKKTVSDRPVFNPRMQGNAEHQSAHIDSARMHRDVRKDSSAMELRDYHPADGRRAHLVCSRSYWLHLMAQQGATAGTQALAGADLPSSLCKKALPADITLLCRHKH